MNHSINDCMFSFFKKSTPAAPTPGAATPDPAAPPAAARQGWLSRLKAGLGKTASGIASVFGGSRIDEALFEDLENALLMADTGVSATAYLIAQLRQRAKSAQAQTPTELRALLTTVLTELLLPLEKTLPIGPAQPTVVMVTGVNGAGKTTSIGKLTAHLAGNGASVLLAAADTFRAAAREQLAVWADRNTCLLYTSDAADDIL
jgi:fused signal recognition particle receptor